MSKLAFVFAGQGSQYLGMGLDFLTINPKLNELEEIANQILGYETKEIINLDQEKLNQTEYTQPLVLLSSIYAYESLKALNIKPDGMLGFSLGEYSALYASQIFTYAEIINLIKNRAMFMKEASLSKPGSMAAILGLNVYDIGSLCEDIGEGVYIANFNSPVQTVISGYDLVVSKAIELAKEKGAKRAIKLNVSGAFHSPLMDEASQKFKEFLEEYIPQKPMCDLYLNTTADKLILQNLKDEMVKQITSPVRFVESILKMKQDGYTHFLEIGPGTVLSGLIKKIDGDLEVAHLERASDLETVKGWLNDHGFKK